MGLPINIQSKTVISLTELKPGQAARICHIPSDTPVGVGLYDRGVAEGQRVVLERIAPFGSPLWFRFDELPMLLRRDEAAAVRAHYDDEREAK
ncbi:MAG: ferrous iron transport protein A [Deltaproteobacteria bacterium]|nr:ferrous iron transport protein A [Deltaproteobacteria bacterium]